MVDYWRFQFKFDNRDLLSTLWSARKTAVKPYFWRILISLDQFLNVAILNGNPDETVSSHCWRHQHKRMIRFIDWVFSPWEQNHCQNSFEADE